MLNEFFSIGWTVLKVCWTLFPPVEIILITLFKSETLNKVHPKLIVPQCQEYYTPCQHGGLGGVG